MPHRVARRGDVDALALDEYLSGDFRIGPENRPRRLRPAAADEARNADDLALADAERHLRALRIAPQSFDPQRFARDRDILAKGVLALETAPDHHMHDLGDAQSGERPRGDELAVAQHGHPVADLGRPRAGDAKYRGS